MKGFCQELWPAPPCGRLGGKSGDLGGIQQTPVATQQAASGQFPKAGQLGITGVFRVIFTWRFWDAGLLQAP